MESNVHDIDTPITEFDGFTIFQTDTKPKNPKTGPKLVRMSFSAWKKLNPEDRSHWDKVSEPGKKVILEEGRNKGSGSNKVERRSINNHDFYFDFYDEEDKSSIGAGVHEIFRSEAKTNKRTVTFTEDTPKELDNYKLPEEMFVRKEDVRTDSDDLLKMATTHTIHKKETAPNTNGGIDIHHVLSQPSKKKGTTKNRQILQVQRSEHTPFDFFDAPIGSYQVNMHRSKPSAKKDENSEEEVDIMALYAASFHRHGNKAGRHPPGKVSSAQQPQQNVVSPKKEVTFSETEDTKPAAKKSPPVGDALKRDNKTFDYEAEFANADGTFNIFKYVQRGKPKKKATQETTSEMTSPLVIPPNETPQEPTSPKVNKPVSPKPQTPPPVGKTASPKPPTPPPDDKTAPTKTPTPAPVRSR